MSLRVASAREAVALDAESIDNGVPARALMRVAGANAATIIAQRYGARLMQGVTIYTGPGNNGGDGWCVARALARTGVPVHVIDVTGPNTPEAAAERAAAAGFVMIDGQERRNTPGHVVIDALLGTGQSGALRGPVAQAVTHINDRRERGDDIIALDVPTGLDATTGKYDQCVAADLTITFGTAKRGHLIARAICGEIVVVDIGLDLGTTATLPLLIDAAWVAGRVPAIPANAHKGNRKKLVIVGGAEGMGGSAVLAAIAALHSGIGMVRVATHPRNVTALQARVPEALTADFPSSDTAYDELAQWGDTLLIGPGLGRGPEARAMVEEFLARRNGPVVLDADALTVFEGDVDALAKLLGKKPTVITPHPAEFARLAGTDVTAVLDQRYDIAADIARALHAAVLLKGTPSVITAPDGARLISAAGTPALATGGSGDVLSGIVATLLAHGCAPHIAAGCAAWVHGRAAELSGRVRGTTLNDVIARISDAWQLTGHRAAYPIVGALPRID